VSEEMLVRKKNIITLSIVSSLLFFVLGIAATSLLFLFISFCLLGITIFTLEYNYGFLSPFSPSFAFWIGYFLSYLVGYLLCDRWYFTAKYGFSNILFEFILLVMAMEFFTLGVIFGYFLVFKRNHIGWANHGYSFHINKLRALANLNPKKMLLLCLVISTPFLLFMTTHPGYIIGWIENKYDISNTVAIGLTRHIENVAFVFLLLYFIKKKTESQFIKLCVLITLLTVSVLHTLQAIMLGGRASLLVVIICWYLFYFGLSIRKGIIMKPIYIALLVGFVSISYTAIMGAYRCYSGYGSGTIGKNRLEHLMYATHETISNFKTLIQIRIGNRLFEESGLFIISLRRQRDENFGFKGFDNFFLQYIPKAIYKAKGSNLGNDILWFEGYRVLENSFAPITLLGDAYYRFGLVGIVVVYFLYGVLISVVSGKLLKNVIIKSNLFSFIILAVLTKFLVRTYSFDIIGALELITYEIPIIYIFSYVVLKVLGIVPKRQMPFRTMGIQRASLK